MAHLNKDERRYLITVLRLDIGAKVTILDGVGGLYQSTIAQVGKEAVVCELGPLETATGESEREVHLWMACIKSDRMEWLIQKATELGVAAIHLMDTARTVMHHPDGKMDRWRKIAREAAEQSERGRIPAILDSRPLAGRSLPLGAFYCAERRPDVPSIRTAAGKNAGEALHVLVGPEGGWTEAECAMFAEKGAGPVSLGTRILRAETAAIAALALLLLE